MRSRKIFIAAILIGFLGSLNQLSAQVYNIATEDGNSISTCTGGFTDSDAFEGDIYVNNEAYMVTFCSDQPGECIIVDFTSFDVPDAQDFLYIYDGPDTTSGVLIGQYNSPFGNNNANPASLYPNGIQSTSSCLTFVFISDSDFSTGTGWDAVISCGGPCPTCYDGIQNGAELDIDCGGLCEPCPEPINIANPGTYTTCGSLFVDSGGEFGDYSDNEDNTVTICSDNPNPNYCVAADFVQFQLHYSGWGSPVDFLYIYDGPSTSYPLIGVFDAQNPPGEVLATDDCLTFRFTSNGWSVEGGWIANVNCQPCAEEPVPTIADCIGALSLCSTGDIVTGAPTGSGNYADVVPANNCGITDNNSVWYVFDVTSSGILNFDLNSVPLTNNYNWSLFDMTGLDCETFIDAPILSCNGYIDPGGDSGPTGISTANGGIGDFNTAIPYNADLNIGVGTYALVINNASASAGFDINFAASTAIIEDNSAPTITYVVANCANNEITVTFSEQVDCSSISEMDFEVVGASGIINILSVSSYWCSEGYGGSLTYTLLLDGFMDPNSAYVLSLNDDDGGVEDICGNVNDLQSYAFNTGASLNLITDITPSDCAETTPTGEVDIQVVGGVEPYYLEMQNQYLYDDSIFTFVNLPAGLIPVDVYDDAGCIATFFIDVPTSNSNMDNTINIDNVSCVGGDGSIEVSTIGDIGYGPWNYTISDTAGTILAISNNSDYVFVDNLTVGEYLITIEDLSGLSPCPDNQIIVVDTPDTIITNTVNDTTICYFGNTSLAASVEGGTGSPFTMYWSDGATTQFTTLPNQVTNRDSLINTTTFYVYAEDDLGCTSEVEEVLVTVNPLITFDMTPDTVICGGNELMIGVNNISGGEGFGYEVRWQIGNNLFIDQDSILVIPNEPTTYCVRVNDQCETPDVDSCVTISPNLDIPVTMTVNSDTASCPPYLATFTNTTNPAYVASASWDFGDGNTDNGVLTVDNIYQESGVYDINLTITDIEGCTFDSTFSGAIFMYPEPIAEFSTNPEEPTLINSTVQFKNESIGDELESYWLFDTINQLGESYESDPFFVFPDQLPEEYYNRLVVTNEYGCSDYITKLLVVEEDLTLYVPNSFSPNGDGKNDFFYVKSREIDPVFYHMIIFDRWGKVVFESKDINERWNGSVNGGDYYAQPGVYVYNLAYKISNSTEKVDTQGFVNLLK